MPFRTSMAILLCVVTFATMAPAADYVWDPTGAGPHSISNPANYKGNHTNAPGITDRIHFDGANDKDALLDLQVNFDVGEFDIDAGYSGTLTVKSNLRLGDPNATNTSNWKGPNVKFSSQGKLYIRNGHVVDINGTNITEVITAPLDGPEIYIKEDSELRITETTQATKLEATVILSDDDPHFKMDTDGQQVELISTKFSGATDGHIEIDASGQTEDRTVLKLIGKLTEDGVNQNCKVTLKSTSIYFPSIDAKIELSQSNLEHHSGDWRALKRVKFNGGLFLPMGSGSIEFVDKVEFTNSGSLDIKYASADYFHIFGDGIFGDATTEGTLTFEEPANPDIDSWRELYWDGDVEFKEGRILMRQYFDQNDSSYSRILITGDLSLTANKVDFYYRSHGTETSNADATEFINVEGVRTGNFDKLFNKFNENLAGTHDFDWDNTFDEVFWTQVMEEQ